ncbi:hypothetical protein WPAWT_00742 [Pseudomonas aeruginosa]|nr:hypothetical protein WPAWT_00742 [Pseudomonas aeruginosa]
MNALPTSLLQRLLERPAPFALLYRPESNGPGLLDVIRGETLELHGLADLPLDQPGPGLPRHDLLALIPYRQIAERGFEALDDGTPLLALKVLEQELLPLEQALALLPNQALELSEEGFDLDDEAYAEVVGRVIADEIGRGEGANFVIKRRFQARIDGYATASALSFFRQLLLREKGAYWTFIVHTGERTLVGASPERHISVRDGLAVMNPISGTYRYPPAGPNLAEVMEFLDNRKEADELYMVVDEELKDDGADLRGRRPGARSLPQGDGAPGAHRVLHRGPDQPRRARGAARDAVRPDRHRQPAGKRLPGDPPLRAAGSRLLQRGGGADRRRRPGRAHAGLGDPDPHRRNRGRRPPAHRRRLDHRASLRSPGRGGGKPGQGFRADRRAEEPGAAAPGLAPARGGGAGQPQRADRRLLAARRQRAPAVAGRPVRTRGADRRCRGHLHLDDRQAAQVAGPDGDRARLPGAVLVRRLRPGDHGPRPGQPHRDRPAEDRPPAPGHPFAAQRAPAVPRRVPEPPGC